MLVHDSHGTVRLFSASVVGDLAAVVLLKDGLVRCGCQNRFNGPPEARPV